MTDEQALLAAIAAHPDEDAVRLVYADFLEENDQSGRAEFVRVQVELARGTAKAARRRALERRQRGLLAAHRARWVAPLAIALSLGPGQCRGWVFRRGFVECFRLSGKVAVSRGAKLAALTPVRELTVSPATPAQVVALCKRPWLANLTHLYLPDTELNDAAARALIACPHLRRLRVFRHGGSTLGYDVDDAFLKRFRAALLRKV